jgi:hypothetical protein
VIGAAVNVCACLSARLPVCLFLHLSVCLPACLPACTPVMGACLFFLVLLYLHVCLYNHNFVHPSGIRTCISPFLPSGRPSGTQAGGRQTKGRRIKRTDRKNKRQTGRHPHGQTERQTFGRTEEPKGGGIRIQARRRCNDRRVLRNVYFQVHHRHCLQAPNHQRLQILHHQTRHHPLPQVHSLPHRHRLPAHCHLRLQVRV